MPRKKRESRNLYAWKKVIVLFLKHRMYIYGGYDIREGSFDNLWYIDLGKVGDLEKTDDVQERDFKW